ncbi:sensor histidine kinase [Goodfellowiella coeruleoviolacea]|uniref:histidine kinase n=1 Tax=Goodfellowiella coeruleoviolacea TaxID=334858 RepID=A0AAE3KJG5_9PSEU|nr:sensor histidine kinase [Goodfellowiella coeruleoviolacea]MCP2169057.1 Signal transduction histidine kinase [Goodfellowiella coeruleoviolacea]
MPPRAPLPRRGDALLAAAAGALVAGITTAAARWQPDARPLDLLGYGLLLATALPLAWRRRFPRSVLLLTAALTVAYYLGPYPGGPLLVVPTIALFTLAVLAGPVRAGLLGGAAMAAVVLARLVNNASWAGGGGLVALLAWLLAVTSVGAAVRARRLSQAAQRDQAQERARRLAEEERLRIAREVHDVVAHSLAVIHVQAGVGAHVADRRPEQAKQALLAIKEASRTALTDLRATLEVLRSGGDRAPSPSLRHADELFASVRATGMRVAVRGAPGELPAPVDAAAYRVLQEALTNAVRHAVGATEVTVTYARDPAGLEIVVGDNGTGSAPGSPGSGLRGMRERVEALGGELTTGPGAGGFTVRARLPVQGGA